MESRRNILGAPIVPDRPMKKISELCQIIGKHKTPVYIPSLPETKIERHYCTRAVNQKIMRDGGKACSGWMIWQWAAVFYKQIFAGAGRRVVSSCFLVDFENNC